MFLCKLCGQIVKTRESDQRICDKCYEYSTYQGGAAVFVEDEILRNKALRVTTVAQELMIERLRRNNPQ